MYGQHDLVRLDWPGGKLSRLTTDPHVDRSPKISPDGTRVAFARSRLPWVSFRNNDEWDVWVLDLATGRERRLAERGAEPDWLTMVARATDCPASSRGRIIFSSRFMVFHLDDGEVHGVRYVHPGRELSGCSWTNRGEPYEGN